MHVLHLLKVSGESADDALANADSITSEWGDADNWRTFFVAFDAKGHATWETGEEGNLDLANVVKDLREDIAEKLALTGQSDGTEFGDWVAGRDLQARGDAKTTLRDCGTLEAFDPWAHSYRSWQIDTFGVTHLHDEARPGEQLYLVVVDMHT